MLRLLLPALLVLCLNSPCWARGGDFSGTGGGGGVACFATEADAKAADRFLKAGQALPDSLFQKAQLELLEHWEMEQSGFTTFPVKPGATWQEILAQAKANLHMVAPVFFLRMEKAADWMQFASWENAASLAPLADATPQKPLPANCRRIQLAVRYSQGNHSHGEGPVKGRIQLKVVLDQRSFTRLSAIDQAMLVLHEQLYAMGQAVGHENSDKIRNFVRLLFDARTLDWKNEAEGGVWLTPVAWFLQQKLVENFGDYVLFFAGLDLEPGLPFTPGHHLATFVRMVQEMREFASPCHGRENEMVCMKRTIDYMTGRKDLTDEQAFLFLAYFTFEQALRKLNAESLMDMNSNPIPLALAMSHTCLLLENVQAQEGSPGATVLAQSQKYCRDWRASGR